MMLTGRNEWIAIGALILWIAFVPCPYEMKQFFASPIGKVVALGAVIYAWKYVSMSVAVLLLVAFLRSGAVREFADDPSIQPAEPNCHCESGFEMDPATKQCKKGTETKPAQCCAMNQEWDGTKCKDKDPVAPVAPIMPPGGPDGGSTGSAAAMASMSATPSVPTVTEGFTPYGGKDNKFAPA